AQAVADGYAGTLADVLRLAVPPRHAQVEAEPVDAPVPGPPGRPGPGPWSDYPAGPAFLQHLAGGRDPQAVWTALPGAGHWAEALAVAAGTVLAGGRSALIVLPDRRDVDTVEAAVRDLLGPDRHVRLEADLGPARRYRAFLAALRGRARLVLGTRAAAFAPLPDLGLVAAWDDGDTSHVEPRAPYPQVREVLALRAEQSGAALLLGGWSRSVEAQRLVERGRAHGIEADRALRRRRWPRVVVAADEPGPGDPGARAARLPSPAWRAVQQGLRRGPVLVQVPRSGYLPGTACQTCRAPARCPHCQGPVVVRGPGGGIGTAVRGAGGTGPGGAGEESTGEGAGGPVCSWCARPLTGWTCPQCGGHRLRARAIGVERTAEELGRAFPGNRVVVARPGAVPAPVRAGLVLATPGVEPPAADGYAATVLLDGDVLLGRADLRAGEEALRRWLGASALTRPAAAGGVVMICADPAAPAVQALVRLDPAGFAARELDERAGPGLPPAVTAVTVTGPPGAVSALLDSARLPGGAEVAGPVPVPERRETGGGSAGRGGPGRGRGSGGGAGPAAEPAVRALVRVPDRDRAALVAALRAAMVTASARRVPPVRVQLDPRDLD
ncbi:MAG: primosome assembly protein PriA, partial [Kineosporiaceae bacterium]